MTIKWLPPLFSPYLLKRGLLLNLTLTDSARMVGHQASRFFLHSPLSQCGITGSHGHTRLFMCWWGFELRVASTLSTEKSPQTPVILVLVFFPPASFLDYAWLRSGEAWGIVSKVWLFTTINLIGVQISFLNDYLLMKSSLVSCQKSTLPSTRSADLT